MRIGGKNISADVSHWKCNLGQRGDNHYQAG